MYSGVHTDTPYIHCAVRPVVQQSLQLPTFNAANSSRDDDVVDGRPTNVRLILNKDVYQTIPTCVSVSWPLPFVGTLHAWKWMWIQVDASSTRLLQPLLKVHPWQKFLRGSMDLARPPLDPSLDARGVTEHSELNDVYIYLSTAAC